VIRADYCVLIRRPAEEVVAFLVDPTHATEWQAAVAEVRSESAPPTQLGSRIRESRRFLGQRLESVLEVTVFEPFHSFSVRTVSGPVSFAVAHTLTQRQDGTELGVSLTGDPGAFFALAEAVVGRVVQRELETSYLTLTEILEDGCV
jgi:hypothetical protein